MWAVGVFLLHVSGIAWLLPNELARTFFNLSGVRGGTFGKALEPSLQKRLAEKESWLRELRTQRLGASSKLSSEGV